MKKDKSFKQVIDRTKDIAERFGKIEGRPWGIEGAMIELSKQVGELSALVMSREGYYHKNREKENPKLDPSKENISDELSDLLFIVIRIADYYGIDLEEAHLKALDSASENLKVRGV
jgi:NTP pyrophosphatase (non-canonical NTP hydrolase)